MRDEIAPVRTLGAGERRPYDLEILGPVGIGPQNQGWLAEQRRVMLAVVLDGRLARGDQPRRRIGLVEVEEPAFRRLMIVDRDLGKAPGLAGCDRDEISRGGFLVDQGVVFDRRSQPMPEHARRPMIAIETDVVKGRSVVGPYHRPADVGHDIGKVYAGSKITDSDGVE